MPSAPAPRLKPADYLVLLVLGDEELHGYGIMQTLSERTGGRETLLPGTLYAALARMVAAGLLEEREPAEPDPSGGPPRRYYRRTEQGRALAQAESARLRALVSLAVEQDLLPESGR